MAAGFLILAGLGLIPVQIRAADADTQLPLSQYGIDTWDGADGLP